MRRSTLVLPALAGVFLCASDARAGKVQIVDHPGSGFATIQAAVDAAVDGDVLLVGSGSYDGFTISGKSLWVIEAPGSTVKILRTVTIENLASTQAVLLSGLDIDTYPHNYGPAVVLDQNQGHVRLQDTRLEGSVTYQGEDGAPGLQATASQKVILVGCTVLGGDGPDGYGETRGPGGNGINAVDTAIALYDCNVVGGEGGEEGWPKGGDGGDGCNVVGWGIFASGCTIWGGHGGGGDGILIAPGGDGGDGLDVTAAQARLLDNSLLGGAGGQGSNAPNGTPGLPIRSNGALVDLLAGTRRKLTGPVLAGDTARAVLTLTGLPGDLAYLLTWNAPGYGFLKPLSGVWALPSPLLIGFVPLGPVPASGTLNAAFQPPNIGGVSPVRALYLQAYCVEPGGKAILTSPRHLALLDVLGMPDCNGNAIIDFLDTTTLGGADCDENLVPDICDPDCNGNNTPDACDLAAGLESDCNKNSVPDSCDLLSGTSLDCNANAIPDECDIQSGHSKDGNKNGIPDECEMLFITYHVDAAAPPGGNGTPGMPFRSIGEALAVTVSGDRVLVQDGVYVGPENRDMDLAERDVVVESVNGPAACIIDCEDSGRAFLSLDYPPIFANPTVRGFTIRRGFSDEWGGAFALNSGTVSNCVIESCRARTGGAVAIYNFAVIEDSTFTNNVAYGVLPDGGAIYAGPPTIVRRCDFVGNQGRLGGAVRLYMNSNQTNTISHNTFLGNHATFDGGALAVTCASPQGIGGLRVDDNLFAGNSAGRYGGALFANVPSHTSGRLWVSGCTLVGNQASVGGGLAVYGSDAYFTLQATLDNCVLWNNSAPSGSQLAVFKAPGASNPSSLAVAYCDVLDGQAGVLVAGGILTWGDGNLNRYPLFVDPDGPDNDPLTLLDNDYRLGRLSPCTDAGDTSAIPPDTSDIDGDGDTTEPVPLDLDLLARRADDPAVPDTGVGPAPVVDMGAYERRP
jgi:predicted outer membrane repeat protein